MDRLKWIQAGVGLAVFVATFAFLRSMLFGQYCCAPGASDGTVSAGPVTMGIVVEIILSVLVAVGAATIASGRRLLAWVQSLIQPQPQPQYFQPVAPHPNPATMTPAELFRMAVSPPPPPPSPQQMAMIREAIDRAIVAGDYRTIVTAAEQLHGGKFWPRRESTPVATEDVSVSEAAP